MTLNVPFYRTSIKFCAVMKANAVGKVECIDRPIRRDLPAFRERGDDGGRNRLTSQIDLYKRIEEVIGDHSRRMSPFHNMRIQRLELSLHAEYRSTAVFWFIFCD